MKTTKLFIALGFLGILSNCSPTKSVRKNGGIQYATTIPQKDLLPFEKITLPPILEEISGLQIFNNTYLGFNDSGGTAEIYQISKNDGEIIKTIKLKNVENVDFESIAIDEQNIYIGDFGNNKGDRQNLRIYYFPKNILNDSPEQTVEVQTIKYHYPEQTDFSNQNRMHDFDCEAMFVHQGKIHLFTKEWKSLQTHHYTVEIQKGKQAAKLLEVFDAGFLITGADALTVKNKTHIALVGYTISGEVYMLKTVVPSNEQLFFTSQPTRYALGTSLGEGQVEGVAFASENEICISAERFKFEEKKVLEHISCYKIIP